MRYPIPSLVLFSAVLGLGVPTLATAQPSPGFCTEARHHIEADLKLSEAVGQVFGKPDYSVQTRQDAACIYPLQVLRYGTADVLLTIGNEPGQACHGCSASLSAYFLARQVGGLKLVNKVVDFGQVGTSGDPGDISPIRIGHDDGIAIESGGTFQGHTSKALDFYAFHAGRVVHVEASPRVTLSASNAGAIADRQTCDRRNGILEHTVQRQRYASGGIPGVGRPSPVQSLGDLAARWSSVVAVGW